MSIRPVNEITQRAIDFIEGMLPQRRPTINEIAERAGVGRDVAVKALRALDEENKIGRT